MKEDTKTEPKHYTDIPKGQQSIEIIETYGLGFCLGNCIKYILRAGRKEDETILDDLKKAKWYLDRFINSLENKENSKGGGN